MTHAQNLHRTPNRLANASSPYLLQHAYNPVDWYEWGTEALQKAQAEDKPIIVSIGYSACHWCHVMERECFENEALAALMNAHFVCIKVDREERPDVDQVYMEAAQAMGTGAGWPLNVFLTPEAKPFYGGTYFPPRNWGNLLQQIAQAFRQHRQQIEDSAEQFTRVLNRSEAAHFGLQFRPELAQSAFALPQAHEVFDKLAKQFDAEWGGTNRAPKFPMPSIYLFLLHYYQAGGKPQAIDHACLTLDQMARGGIYDQIGGGFARYSVDEQWLVPHFEKMLYDNGQLIGLYSEAYAATQSPLYKQVVYETIDFVARELASPEHGFYSALDADSEGIEGRFYVWTNEELNEVLHQEAPLAKAYYQCRPDGNWEHGYNILHLRQPEAEFCQQHGIGPDELAQKVAEWKRTLLAARAKRIRPGLDDKIITAWNALMIKGLADAYAAFGEARFLEMAEQNARFIAQNMYKPDGGLWRTYKNGRASIDAYLEDYALCIQAFLALYQVGFDPQWLRRAEQLAQYSFAHFFDETENFFFFVADNAEQLVARKKELFDNVIPASNSIMAHNLHTLSLLAEGGFERKGLPPLTYGQLAEQMLVSILPLIQSDVRYLANWGSLFIKHLQPTVEVAIVGPQYRNMAAQLHSYYWPNKVVAATPKAGSTLPLLQGRGPSTEGHTQIYVCRNRACLMPVQSVAEAWAQINASGQ